MTVGERIKQFRKQAKLTQRELSEITGIAEITIRQYEANKYSPKINNIEKIAVALNVNPSELINIPEDSDINNLLKYIPSAQVETVDNKQRILLFNLKELENYFKLNEKGKKKVLSYIEDLVKLSEYTEDEIPNSD